MKNIITAALILTTSFSTTSTLASTDISHDCHDCQALNSVAELGGGFAGPRYNNSSYACGWVGKPGQYEGYPAIALPPIAYPAIAYRGPHTPQLPGGNGGPTGRPNK